MTDREIMQQALEALEFFWNAGYRNVAEQQKTLITALRERLAQPEQEPVAKAWNEGYRQGVEDECISAANIGIAGFGAKVKPARQNPYGITPPQRTWVGLTDEEVKNEWVVWRASLPRYVGFAKGIEAKLKEKNA